MAGRIRYMASLIVLTGGLLCASSAVMAAPQVLGLVASIRPTAMQCTAAGCRADLSAFCLQQQRPDPGLGTAYRPAPNAAITLIVTAKSGEVRRLDGTRYLSFIDDRGFTSMTARLAPDALAGIDVSTIAIEIGKDASLLPQPKAGDENPQMADELALATGVNRQKAEVYFDRSGRDADAIRLTNAMINNLAPHGRTASDTDGSVLKKTLSQYQGAAVDRAGLDLAEEIHRQCVYKTDVTHHVDSMRDCLEGSHDVLVTHTNIDFWDSLGGS
jgi:hypothetical protein